MRKMLTLVMGLAIGLASLGLSADQWVNGYSRSDGTYVQGHYRSSPNSTVTDNFSFKGNRNPYTGEIGSNRYESNPTSPYYNGRSSGSSAFQPYQNRDQNSFGIGNSRSGFGSLSPYGD